jgi:D-alanine-D-alanine ligase
MPATKKPVLILFGGVSAEHEVSVITGLQVVEAIDRENYIPYTIYVDKKGGLFYLQNLKDRGGFFTVPRKSVSFGRDARGGYAQFAGALGGLRTEKIYPYAAYLAFHGGKGESGPMQGLMESVEIPFTSPGQEASAVTMNKELTRRVAEAAGIPVAPGMSVFAAEIKKDAAGVAAAIINNLSLPVIIKPAHLGSSIGLNIARTDIELQKFLLEATFIDNEILVEKYLSLAAEYNCAVRAINGVIETSEIERPVSKDEILSFADKYQRGAKKTGGSASGMASLNRELPAKIDESLRREIQDLAKRIFVACACKGMIRIDFMLTTDHKLYLTEPNPIPGSMAFYLWEASGIPFKQQISDMIEQAVRDEAQAATMHLDYETDIIEKFTGRK